jgi:uracil-DNA glycosylase
MAFFYGACMQNFIEQAHPEWHEIIAHALDVMDEAYLKALEGNNDYLPPIHSLLAAFSLPLSSTNYILLGESPYPRKQSANGYAFWDNGVGSLWSASGLSKEVNRATSLRNLIKMFLFARGNLTNDFSQEAIAALNKSEFQQTGRQLFEGFMQRGFLLLNASLVYSEGKVPYHARQWRPFIHCLFNQLAEKKPSLKLVLLGRIADQVPKTKLSAALVAEHPYNISFITNPRVIAFFRPFDILVHENLNEKNNN